MDRARRSPSTVTGSRSAWTCVAPRSRRAAGRGRAATCGRCSQRLDAAGCARYVVTDVTKDGTLRGPNLDLLREVCARTDAPGGGLGRGLRAGRPRGAARRSCRSGSRARSSARRCTRGRSRCPRRSTSPGGPSGRGCRPGTAAQLPPVSAFADDDGSPDPRPRGGAGRPRGAPRRSGRRGRGTRGHPRAGAGARSRGARRGSSTTRSLQREAETAVVALAGPGRAHRAAGVHLRRRAGRRGAPMRARCRPRRRGPPPRRWPRAGRCWSSTRAARSRS